MRFADSVVLNSRRACFPFQPDHNADGGCTQLAGSHYRYWRRWRHALFCRERFYA